MRLSPRFTRFIKRHVVDVDPNQGSPGADAGPPVPRPRAWAAPGGPALEPADPADALRAKFARTRPARTRLDHRRDDRRDRTPRPMSHTHDRLQRI